jgi:hypothetical protein
LDDLPNCEMSRLDVTQMVLFSTYRTSPPHEPNGVLPAARCHPMIAYRLIANDRLDSSQPVVRIDSVRFDYRIHPRIDRHWWFEDNENLRNRANNAGTFRDLQPGEGELPSGISAPTESSQPSRSPPSTR